MPQTSGAAEPIVRFAPIADIGLVNRGTVHPTGEIGPGVGFVPGEGGEGTSMSGECVGMPGGGSVGWPGFDGSGVAGAGVVGGSWGSGCCMRGCLHGLERA
jgi:hypothetical protein